MDSQMHGHLADFRVRRLSPHTLAASQVSQKDIDSLSNYFNETQNAIETPLNAIRYCELATALTWFRYRRVKNASLCALAFASSLAAIGGAAIIWRYNACSKRFYNSLEDPAAMRAAIKEALEARELPDSRSQPAAVTADGPEGSRWEEIRRNNTVITRSSTWDAIRQRHEKSQLGPNPQEKL